jgi:hypothetical protein
MKAVQKAAAVTAVVRKVTAVPALRPSPSKAARISPTTSQTSIAILPQAVHPLRIVLRVIGLTAIVPVAAVVVDVPAAVAAEAVVAAVPDAVGSVVVAEDVVVPVAKYLATDLR